LQAAQKYCLLLLFLVFPWPELSFFLDKMEDAQIHLVLPITHVGPCHAHLGSQMDT